jgi:hypothetical protein
MSTGVASMGCNHIWEIDRQAERSHAIAARGAAAAMQNIIG